MSIQAQTTSGFDIRTLLRTKDAVLALALILIVVLMISPLPPLMIDILVAFNIALSIGVLLISMYIAKPMDFSVFPTALLLVTLFRLGLNISVSRAILLNGEAGKVVSVFGDMVVGGNYVVGVVVFLMLMVIQFVVITNGSGRVAEVSARFTLDAMPGKQLAIDADLNSGLIDESEARLRRLAIEVEADFYGAMDGASKFVRGDAIAALVIVLVNIVGGFIIGALQFDLSLLDSLQRYALLTVGAGLVIQIPALLVSTAAGLIVTRSTSDESLGSDIVTQFSNFHALLAVTIIITCLTLVPGIPKVPFLIVGSALGAITYVTWQVGQRVEEEPEVEEVQPEAPEDMLSMLMVDPLELEIGYGLIPLVSENNPDNLLRRIVGIRRQIISELGLIMPIVRVRDNLRLQPNSYRIKLRGEEIAQSELILDHFLAIPGSEVDEKIPGIPSIEPAFGLPATWINEAEKGRAELLGYTVVDPLSVLSTHLTEIVRNQAAELLGRQEVHDILEQLKAERPAVVEGLIPDVLNLGEIQAVLRNLLLERVPIRDLGTILEVLANNASITHDPDVLAEAVRQNLSRTISNMYRDAKGCVHVFTLSPELELTLKSSLGSNERGLFLQIDPNLAQGILAGAGGQMEHLAKLGHRPVLLCPRELRLAFRRLVERALPNLVVLAFSEICPGTKVKSHGMVEQP
jgi:flagellar biosynthesis protein FlhA